MILIANDEIEFNINLPKLNNLNKIQIFLIIILLLGVFLRLYDLSSPHTHLDEIVILTSALKFQHQSYEAGNLFSPEHPPIAKLLMGLPTLLIDADYTSLTYLSNSMYVYMFTIFDIIARTYTSVRLMSALFGIFSILLCFLITKKLFGLDAALWSSLLMSTSFDLLLYSRLIFMDIFMVTFTLLTIYLYILYINQKNENNKALLLILFTLSMILTLGSRSFQPILLIPIFTITHLLIVKWDIKEKLEIPLACIIAFVISYLFLYGSDQFLYSVGIFDAIGTQTSGLFQMNILLTTASLVLRNSYIFAFSVLAICYTLITKPKTIKRYVSENNNSYILIIFFIISYLTLSFTKYTIMRYTIFLFIPIYIIGGKIITNLNKNRIISILTIIILLVSLTYNFLEFPYDTTYTNFNIGGFETLNNIEFEASEKAIIYLSEKNYDFIISNSVDILISDEIKNKIPLMISQSENCQPEIYTAYSSGNNTIVYFGYDIKNDPYICEHIRTSELKELKSYNNILTIYSY